MPEARARRRRVRFDQMAELVNDRVDDPAESGVERYVGLEHLDADSLRIRRWGEITDVESTKLRFQPGDIIFGKRRVYQRKLALADFEGICSAHAMVLRARPECALPAFLPYFMQSDYFMERALQISVGSLSPTINWKTLAEQEFALPPIEEQRRMVRGLVATETLLDGLYALKEGASAAAKSILDAWLRALVGNVPSIPVSKILVDGPKNGLSPKPSSQERGFRSVSIGAISGGKFNPEGHEKYVDLTPDGAAPYVVREGDIFAVRGNGNRRRVARVGRSAISYDDLIYPDLLMRMRFDPKQIVPEFLVAQWNHPTVHARLLARAKSSNGIWKVNGQDIRAHELLLPSLSAQQEIVDSLHQITWARSTAQARIAMLRRVKRELMSIESEERDG